MGMYWTYGASQTRRYLSFARIGVDLWASHSSVPHCWHRNSNGRATALSDKHWGNHANLSYSVVGHKRLSLSLAHWSTVQMVLTMGVVLFAYKTFTRNPDWADTGVLVTKDIAAYPESTKLLLLRARFPMVDKDTLRLTMRTLQIEAVYFLCSRLLLQR